MMILKIVNDSNNFLIGFAAPILATIIIWGFYKVFKEYIIPKYLSKIYKGILIEGKWGNKINNPDSGRGAEGIMNLIQRGTRLNGELILKSTRDNQSGLTIIYDLSGELINDLVFLYGTPKDRHQKSFTAGLFIVKDGGQSLNGGAIGTDNFTSELFSRDNIIWVRE